MIAAAAAAFIALVFCVLGIAGGFAAGWYAKERSDERNL